MGTLKLYWLGAPLIELKGETFKLETRKAMALLTYLSLNPGQCQRERLSTMFWSEANQQKALANLRRTLSSLNSSLPGWIEADRETITLKRNDKLWVDVHACHQLLSQFRGHNHTKNEVCEECLSVLDHIVTLYRGDFLEGFNLSDCPTFDEWQFFQRDGLRQEFARVLDCLSTGYAERKQWEPAILSARRWVAQDRLHEPACRKLMDLYVRSGQRTAAVHQYEEVTRLLHEQMGQEPEQETRRLYEQIIGQEGAKPIREPAERLSQFPLLKTKLYIPAAPASRVIRSHLINRLDEAQKKALTIISAPAGFGKTTLLGEWIVQSSLPVAWLSLDSADNDPYRFLSYLIAALESIQEDVGGEAKQLLQSSQLLPSHIILASLINDLGKIAEPHVLILDDYQFINEHTVHETVAYLLDHIPSNMHMVIATRADPPLQLGRLRAYGQLLELRTQDLRFTPEEATGFLNEVMWLGLSAEDIEALVVRTEGWVVGLQMAALSLRGQANATEFIRAFSGSHRYILDYLLEEVLAGQSPEIQRFLLYTSVLERLTAPLCDALLANDEESKPEGDDWSTRSESLLPHGSASILEYLERANLFLVSLDDERTWYRYHHLFADLLRARLDQFFPGLAPCLHARAAAWLEKAEMTVEAVNHTLSAGAYDQAARLVEENTTRLLAQGELNSLMSWIKMLPAKLRLARPWLCIHQAYALVFAGRSAEVGPLLAQAESALRVVSAQGIVSPSEDQALKGAVAAVRAMTAAIMLQDVEALSQAQQALDLLAAGDFFNRSLAMWALGYALHNQGHLPEACSAFEEQVRLSRAIQNDAILMIGLTALARVLADQGKFGQARILMEKALVEASQKGVRNLGFIARMEAHLAGVLYQQNELEGAHHLLSDALNHARFWPNPNHLAFINIYQARVLLAEGDLQGVQRTIAEADELRRSALLSDWLRRSLEAEIVWVWLALQSAGMELAPSDPLVEQSNLILDAWRKELAGSAESQDMLMDQCIETALITLARVSLASGQAEEALAILEPVTRNSKAVGHIATAIESLVLTATASQSKPVGRIVSALAALEEALALAEPGGYVRVFLDEGRPMQLLLAQWLAHASAGPLRDYAMRLLSQFDGESIPILSRDNP